MFFRLAVAVVILSHGQCWWFGNESMPPPETASKRWQQFRNRFPKTEEAASTWYNRCAGWLVSGVFEDFGHHCPAGGRFQLVDGRLLQVLVVLAVCLIAHYLWSVCYPIVSIILALVMALVWVLQRVLRMIGMVFFHAQRLTGGAPEASDAEFHGPGTGAVPETALLRGFKRTGDNPISRWWCDVEVRWQFFSVGTDQQNIRTHGLYLPVEPDTARGSPALVRRLNMADKVHLCRNNICTEDATEHFTEYGVVKKFNFLSRSKEHWHVRDSCGIGLFRPDARLLRTLLGAFVHASESETEDVTCNMLSSKIS